MIIDNINTYQINVTNNCHLNCKHCYTIKKNINMSESTLNNVLQYIITNINNNKDNDPCITISGGEIGLYNPILIKKIYKDIKEKTYPKTPNIVCQTSLLYNLTEEHKDLFKNIDSISTSYDYMIRYKNIKQELLFWNNLNIVKELNKDLQIIIVLSKYMIEEVSPSILFSLILSTGVKHIELERLCKPNIITEDFLSILPENIKVREYLYQCYLIYKELQKSYDIKIDTLDCLEDGCKGNFYYEHGRKCCNESLTFQPNGDILTCFMEEQEIIGNVNTNIINESKRQEIINKEKDVPSECLNCKYYKYCNGDCHRMLWDKTGCSTPYKIYDLIIDNNNDL